jgi:hypothetical protein
MLRRECRSRRIPNVGFLSACSTEQGVEHGRAPARPAGDRRRDRAPVSREGVIACFAGAPAGFSVGITAKVGNERFHLGGNREPQLMWSLVIRHLGNSWPPSPRWPSTKHNAPRRAVTAITARAAKGRPGRGDMASLRQSGTAVFGQRSRGHASSSNLRLLAKAPRASATCAAPDEGSNGSVGPRRRAQSGYWICHARAAIGWSTYFQLCSRASWT